ncbi:MAG TPA: hypothetical protein PKY49_03445, partial [Anaerolineae bacterium]|nr:hypothetical protein [Anaerolineae bacterium]
IAVELPDARLNNDRTFSFLDDVRQHRASPSKIEISGQRISEKANLKITCMTYVPQTSVRSQKMAHGWPQIPRIRQGNANFRLLSGRPGMNSGSDSQVR